MKESKYNVITKVKDKYFAYNSLKCGLAEVNNDFFDILKMISDSKFDKNTLNESQKEIIELMKQGGYIIEDNVDELDRLEFMKNEVKYNTKNLGLTITPTLECNMRCVYCFENRKKGFLSEENMEAIVSFVKTRSKALEKLSVTWYGGEPLSGKEIICKLSEEFIKICDDNNIEYAASIITNGVLIDQETVNKFKKYKISFAQITIDGDEEIHNKRRKLVDADKNGYKEIIKNLQLLLNEDVKVAIRINIDETNRQNYENMLNDLKELKAHEKMKVYFARITAHTDACRSVEKLCIDNKQFAKEEVELTKKLKGKGFSVNIDTLYPVNKLCFCGAEKANSFVIDFEGDMYKCWNDVGVIENSICNIKDVIKDNEVLHNNNYIKWIKYTPIKHEECRECVYLPNCQGGCPYEVIENQKKPQCSNIKYNFDSIIKATVE